MIILITITLASSNNTLPDDGDWNETCRSSWFQTFAVIGILYIFFWVFPRRQIVVGRRFGTLYQFHLQRLGVQCVHSTPSLWRWNWYRVPKRQPTTIWRRGNTQKKIYNIHNLFFSPYFIQMFKSRRNRWAAHLALIKTFRVANRVLVGKPGFGWGNQGICGQKWRKGATWKI